MISLIQRVSFGKVIINGMLYSEIRSGIIVFIGFTTNDNLTIVGDQIDRLIHLRAFPDEQGKTNINIKDAGGELLIIPQFTLAASLKNGNRPSFSSALKPKLANELFVEGCKLLELHLNEKLKKGVFGAEMQIELCNLGPTTYYLNSDLD
jgi:D-aminoacyl-tRNA deacylase